jgi:hypothetical protein
MVIMGKRRYVAETAYVDFQEGRKSYQVVTVYPEEYNLDRVKEDISPLTARKGILRTNNNKTWRYKEL